MASLTVRTCRILKVRAEQGARATLWSQASEGTRVHVPVSLSLSLSLTRTVPPRALPLRPRIQRASRADKRELGRAKDGGAGRRTTPVPGGAVQRLLRGFRLREIR